MQQNHPSQLPPAGQNSKPLYDLAKLRELGRGSEDFIAEMLGIFLENVPETVATMRTAWEEGDLQAICGHAHSIKPILHSLCVTSLTSEVQELEDLAKAEDRKERIGELIRRVQEVVAIICAQLKAPQDPDLSFFIVDDDPYWTSLFSEVLYGMGYKKILHFRSGAACLKELTANPDIVFLDYQMQGMDGVAVLRAIKEYYDGITVIFTTASENYQVAVEAMKHGSFDYLVKREVSESKITKLLREINEKKKGTGKIY